MDKIRKTQKGDKDIEEIKVNLRAGKAKGFHEDEQGILWFEKRVCVANDPDLRKLILQEAHETPFHSSRKYQDVYGCEGEILVEQPEERNSRIYR